jgi:hypothetical protein
MAIWYGYSLVFFSRFGMLYREDLATVESRQAAKNRSFAHKKVSLRVPKSAFSFFSEKEWSELITSS